MLFKSLNLLDMFTAVKNYFTSKLKSVKGIKDEDLARKRTAKKLLDYYKGDQKQYLKGHGFEDSDDGTDLIAKMTLNITKKIIDKVSMVYKYPPVRVLVDKDDVDLEEQNYAKWISYVQTFDNHISEAERQKNLHHKVLWRNHYNPVLRRWQFMIEWDYKAHFMGDDPLNPIGYSVPIVIPSGNLHKEHRITESDQIYLYYDDEYYFYYNTKGETWTYYVDNDGNEKDLNGVNVYGVSPFTELRKGVPVYEYDTLGALDLISANESININLNNLNMALHYQAFGLIWDNTGMTEKDSKKILVGANRQQHLPQDTSLNNLDLNPKLLEMIDTVKFEVQAISNVYNLTVNWHTEATPVSGFSLIVQNMDYIEQRQKDVDEAKMQEKQIFKSIRAQQVYHKKDIDKDEPPIPEGKLKVDFTELDLPINQVEEIAIKQYKLDNNIITPIDEIKAENPDMNEAEAIKKYEDNKRINKKFSIGDAIKDRITSLGGQVEE